ncbi:unnamed protein product, partial [Heterosigma akashiwo]
QKARDRLPNKGVPFIGKDGMLQEYLGVPTSDLPDPGHRHLSGLYALYPGGQLWPPPAAAAAGGGGGGGGGGAAGRELWEAAAKGGGHTNWSRAWAAALWARAGRGKEAGESLDRLLKEFTKGNLLTAHPKLESMGLEGCTTCYKLAPKPRYKVLRDKEGWINKFKTRDGSLFQIDGNFGI